MSRFLELYDMRYASRVNIQIMSTHETLILMTLMICCFRLIYTSHSTCIHNIELYTVYIGSISALSQHLN